MQLSACQEGIKRGPVENLMDFRGPAVQWIRELPLKLATGFEPPIVQRQKRLRQLIWYNEP
jgi:hypothetical protein